MGSDRQFETRINNSRESWFWPGAFGNRSRPHPEWSTLIAFGIAAIAILGIVLTLIEASRLPDLRLTSVRLNVNTIAAGERFEVTDQVKSEGAVPSSPTSTDLCLSPTRIRGDECWPLTGSRSIPSMSPGKESTDQTMVTVPAGTLAGRYFVSDCVGDIGPNTESNLRNNCRWSATAIVVTAP